MKKTRRSSDKPRSSNSAMAKDLVPEDLRKAEKEIDFHYVANPLAHQPWARAGWYFLAFCEEIVLYEVIRQDQRTSHGYAAIADNLIVHAKWPLRWLSQACRQVV